MVFIWRHYIGRKMVSDGEVTAPCRVTAKRKVTRAIKEAGVVRSSYRPKWREKVYYTITSLSDLRGIRHPMSNPWADFIVFFEKDNENGMISDLTK